MNWRIELHHVNGGIIIFERPGRDKNEALQNLLKAMLIDNIVTIKITEI